MTEDLHRLRDQFQYRNLPAEVEARWRLVETSWHLNIPQRALEVTHDPDSGLLVVTTDQTERTDLTGTRDALNGYQKGHCFYCSAPIRIEAAKDDPDAPKVDHFLPFKLGREPEFREINVDGVWNLVLACPTCNSKKYAYLPAIRFLEELARRNDYLIASHHPLRSTLIAQTGSTVEERRSDLQAVYRLAETLLIVPWEPAEQVAEEVL